MATKGENSGSSPLTGRFYGLNYIVRELFIFQIYNNYMDLSKQSRNLFQLPFPMITL